MLSIAVKSVQALIEHSLLSAVQLSPLSSSLAYLLIFFSSLLFSLLTSLFLPLLSLLSSPHLTSPLLSPNSLLSLFTSPPHSLRISSFSSIFLSSQPYVIPWGPTCTCICYYRAHSPRMLCVQTARYVSVRDISPCRLNAGLSICVH